MNLVSKLNTLFGYKMSNIKIHILHTGDVRVSPYLPFGGNCNVLKAMGVTTPRDQWLWLPVFCYLIEHPQGRILVDTGWSRSMSPNGVFDRWAQIRSLGCLPLYLCNQGVLPMGQSISEQLQAMGLKDSDLDYVLLTHLDCDHANGLDEVQHAKHILCSAEELRFATHGGVINWARYQSLWWRNAALQTFDWNDNEGPAHHSFDLFGDGSIVLINIPGHSNGMCAVRICNAQERFVLLCADGGYARRSWEEMITSGIATDRKAQQQSLQWIRAQSLSPNCLGVFASHDTEISSQVIELQ